VCHEVVRSGLRKILEAHPDWKVVAEVADGRDAVRKVAETKPDVAVLDYSSRPARAGGFEPEPGAKGFRSGFILHLQLIPALHGRLAGCGHFVEVWVRHNLCQSISSLDVPLPVAAPIHRLLAPRREPGNTLHLLAIGHVTVVLAPG
jgi:DNA-binding NarL/FixJ family response regulator